MGRSAEVAHTPSVDGEPVEANGRTVVIADDDLLLREGLASLLTQAGYSVVGQAGDASWMRRRHSRPQLRRVVALFNRATRTK